MSMTPTAPAEHYPELAHAIAKLTEEFHGVFGRETIERFVGASYADLMKTATCCTCGQRRPPAGGRRRLHTAHCRRVCRLLRGSGHTNAHRSHPDRRW